MRARLRGSLWLLMALACLLAGLGLKRAAHSDPAPPRPRVIIDDGSPPVNLSDYRIGVLEKQVAALTTKIESTVAVIESKLDARDAKRDSNLEWQNRFIFGALVTLILNLAVLWWKRPERREAREVRERREEE